MRYILTVIVCCVCYEVMAQTENKVSTTLVLSTTPNWEEFTSHQASIESTDAKRDRFSCVLNLMKNALSEELQNSYYHIEDKAQDNVSSINKIIEKQSSEDNENQLEKPITKVEIETDAKLENQKVVKSTSDFLNFASEKNNIEMPNMIPIFKPRPKPKAETKQNVNFNSTPTKQVSKSKAVAFVPEKIVQTVRRPILGQSELNPNVGYFSSTPVTNSYPKQKSRAVSFVPEKIVQTNISPIPNQAMFNIPCHRAAEVLDMSVVVPKETTFRNTNVDPIRIETKPIFPSQIPAPVKCAEEDDTIAVLFKPKNISLEQVYGNLLKKITITVLVPYHMSKLGERNNS